MATFSSGAGFGRGPVGEPREQTVSVHTVPVNKPGTVLTKQHHVNGDTVVTLWVIM